MISHLATNCVEFPKSATLPHTLVLGSEEKKSEVDNGHILHDVATLWVIEALSWSMTQKKGVFIKFFLNG